MNKYLFKFSSGLQFLQSLLLRIGCIIILGYLSIHYQENPVVIVILSLIVAIFFFIAGNDQIYIYPNKIIKSDTSLAQFLFRRRPKVYWLEDINAASMPAEKTSKTNTFETAVGIVMLLIMPRRPRRITEYNKVYLNLKNGEIVTLVVDLDEQKSRKLVEVINSLL